MILDKLLEIGFLTGSRAFGTSRFDSDWDVVYSVEDSTAINSIIQGIEQYPSGYFSGYTIMVDGKKINLIPVHPHEYLPWYLATKAMTATLKESGITNTIKKHSVFMGMVSLYKGTVEQLGNLDKYDEVKKGIRLDIKRGME